jgi:hypothetical protein
MAYKRFELLFLKTAEMGELVSANRAQRWCNGALETERPGIRHSNRMALK